MTVDPFINFLFGICLVLFVTGVRQRTSGTDTLYVSANPRVYSHVFSNFDMLLLCYVGIDFLISATVINTSLDQANLPGLQEIVLCNKEPF